MFSRCVQWWRFRARETKGITEWIQVQKKSSAPVNYTVNPTPDYEKAQERLNRATEDKKGIWVDNVSADARQTFVALKKMFVLKRCSHGGFSHCRFNDVEWDGKNIKVLKRVIVKEPFGIMNIEPVDGKNQSTEALKQVRKVVSFSRSIFGCPQTGLRPITILRLVYDDED